MRIFTPEETEARLPYPALAETLGDVLLAQREGRASAPERLHIPLPGGATLLVMPATDEKVAITKLVTVHPENPGKGLPCIQGEVLVMDAATGERLALLDGPALTARRTAAATLLAARLLAPRHGALLLVGAGVQARAHLEAFRLGLGVTKAVICARTPARAEALAEHGRSMGMQAETAPDAATALARGNGNGGPAYIVTATTSETPVLPAGMKGNYFVAGIGAFRPSMTELPQDLVSRAVLVCADTPHAAQESGDLRGVDPDDVTPLARAVARARGGVSLRPGTGPVVFKGTGHALFDLAAAKLALTGL